MSWVSTEKFKTVCEAIKNYAVGQADDAYNKAVKKMGDYVAKSGDTMSGTLDMGENSITNVAEPVNDGDASNKKYVDDAIAASGGDKYVAKTGDIMSGNLSIETKSSSAISTAAIFTASAEATPSGTGATKFLTNLASYGIDFLKAQTESAGKYEYGLKFSLDYRLSNNYVFAYIDGSIKKDGTKQDGTRTGIFVKQIDFNYITGTTSSLSIGVDKDTTRLAVGNMVNPDVGTLVYKRLAVGIPTADEDATTKKYVDSALTNKVDTTAEMTTEELNTILALFA